MGNITRDTSGYYYREWNSYTCWGADPQGYIYNGQYKPSNQYMYNNAELIFTQLKQAGWKNNSICAVIGNMCRECYLNAGQTQINYTIGGTNGGFGLVMWTPQTKYTNWARQENHDVNLAYWQVWFIINKPTPQEQQQWTEKFAYNYMSWAEFISDETHDVEYLTRAFFDCYEKGNPLKANMPYRIYCAEYYATEFYNYDPQDPVNPDPDPYKLMRHKMPLYMMLKKNRLIPTKY